MCHTFSTHTSRILLEAEIDGRQVIGLGGSGALALMFHVRLDLSYPFEQAGLGLMLEELRCQLALESGYAARVEQNLQGSS